MNKIFNSFKLIVLAVIAGLALSSCTKTPEQVNYIPQDANFVVAMNVKNMAVKSLDFKEIFKLENLKDVFSSADTSSEKIKNSGIDLLSTMYAFGQINNDSKGYAAAIIPLTDEAKFEAFVKDMTKEFTVAQEGDFKIGSSKEAEDVVFVWNKNTAIVCGEDGADKSKLKEKVLAFYNLKKEESLGENDKNFQALQKEEADISLWISFEKIGQLASQFNPVAAGMNFKDTYFTAACNFEKGQVVVNSKYHANKELAEKLGIGKENVNKELIGVVPGKTLISLLSLSLDMNKLYAYLEKENLVANIDESAKVAGVSGKELFSIFSGDIIGSVNGAVMQEVQSRDWMTGETVTKNEPRPEYAAVIGIADKTKAATLLEGLSMKGLLEKKDNYYAIKDLGGKDLAYLVDKGSYWMIASESMRQLAIDANGEKLNGELTNLLAENSGVFYFNFTQVPDVALDFLGKDAKEFFKTTALESVTVSGTSLKDNTSAGKFVIAFKDKEQNSLVTLAKMSDELSKKSSQSYITEREADRMVEIDTATASVEVE